jgi:4-diphosphocytidyl-2-C-methyl-D-erythritol kinase
VTARAGGAQRRDPARGGGLREEAPAKVNLCLFVGPARADGRHGLVTVMQPVTLADGVELEPGALGAVADEVDCPGVAGDNLAARALHAFRERTGWTGAPVRLRIDKRIPVAAGMAGGSADAGAALRLAARAAGAGDDGLLRDIAAGLGADVPAQVRPARYLATGAGERLTALPAPAAYGILVLPSDDRLATADVYREADRLGLARDAAGLAAKLHEVSTTAADLPDALVVNDLQDAARSLCPAIDEALAAAGHAGARRALVCGSGPTVIGLFGDVVAARAAAALLADRRPRPVAAAPWRVAA